MLFRSGAMPTTVALTSDYAPARWRTSLVMFMFTGASIGGFFAGQVAAQILPTWGWQGVFMVGGIVPLALLVVLFFVLPESPQFHGGAKPASAKANPVSGLFQDGLAMSTVMLWAGLRTSIAPSRNRPKPKAPKETRPSLHNHYGPAARAYASMRSI